MLPGPGLELSFSAYDDDDNDDDDYYYYCSYYQSLSL